MLVTTAEQAREVAARLAQAKTVAFDFETTGLSWVRDTAIGYSVAVPGDAPGKPASAWYIPLAAGHRGELPLDVALQPLRVALQGRPGGWVLGHNLKFDLHFARQVGVEVRDDAKLLDTLLAARLIREDRPNGLKELSRDLLDYEMTDFDDLMAEARVIQQGRVAYFKANRDELPKKSLAWAATNEQYQYERTVEPSILDVPLDKLAEYGALDSQATVELAQVLLPLIKQKGLKSALYDEDLPYLRVLYEMERTGVAVDLGMVNLYKTRIEAELGEVEAQIDSLVAGTGFVPPKGGFNPGSTAQLVTLFYGTLGLRPTGRRTKTGKPQLDEVALQMLAEQYPEEQLLQLVLKQRDLAKTLSTYYLPLLEKSVDGVIHTSFNQAGTVTGRLSSSDPNLQNQPTKQEVRNLFVARPGMVLLCADYSQAELRMVAHLSQDPQLLDAYRRGLDIHQLTAANLFGVRFEAVTKDQRKLAKPVNFGVLYRMSARKLREQLRWDWEVRVSKQESQRFIDGWYAAYARVGAWQEEALDAARETGVAVNLYGRQRHLDDLFSDDSFLRGRAERQCINFHVQGGVGVLVGRAQVALREALRPFGAYQLLQVHDEILAECPVETAAEAAKVMERVMVECAADLSVPFAADVHAAAKWGEAK